MITVFNTWKGCVEVDGVVYDSVAAFNAANLHFSKDSRIRLLPAGKASNTAKTGVRQDPVEEIQEVRVTVKPYMTKPASPEFDFMARWNNNKPMPLRVMEGVRVKETPGMVYMRLHGMGKPTICCNICGKELTNPVSRHYGIGPICLAKLGIDNDIEDVSGIREKLVDIKWEGWIIKSAILREEDV